MTSCLIGYSGFVGSNLDEQSIFDEKYNSKNIDMIRGRSFGTVYCAGVSAVKWLANKQPDDDLQGIMRLINALRDITAERFILISTIDVYRIPEDVDEETVISTEGLHPYGTHRRMLETFVTERFPIHNIIRLPGLFGNNLKKNIIFDLMYNNLTDAVHSESVYQFYGLDSLSRDIDLVVKQGLSLANFATEPVSVKEIASAAFDLDFVNITNCQPARYDMKTKYGFMWGAHSPYISTKEQVIEQIRHFVAGKQSVGGL